MAITTHSGVISGLQRPVNYIKGGGSGSSDGAAGSLLTYWQYGIFPQAGSYNATLNGVALTAPVTGQIPYTDPASGNGYLAKFTAKGITVGINDAPGILMLCDRLWHNTLSNVTGVQTITTPTWPARDRTGTTNGDDVMVCMELQVGTNTNPGAYTMSYTNQSGTAGKTATAGQSHANDERNQVYEFLLQNGDTGVQSIQSISLGTASGGTFCAVAYRVIASISIKNISGTYSLDALQGAFPRVFNGSVPYFMIRCGNPTGGSNPTPVFSGQIVFAQG